MVEKQRKAVDEEDTRLEPLNRAITAAFVDRALPTLPLDLADEAAAKALTPEDRRSLDKLGTSQEFVTQIMASLAGGEPATGAAGDEATLSADGDVTVPLSGSSFWTGEAADFEQLMTRLGAVEMARQISWPSCYRKLQELGRGGQGIVYLTECLDELCGEQALKIYSPRPYGSGEAYHEDMERMLKVASLVHRIQHDNLVNVQRFVDYRGIYMMVMQWVDGFDLRRLVNPQLMDQLHECVSKKRWTYLNDVIYAERTRRQLCLQPLLAVNIVEKCLCGLSTLHEKNIVHGDIKPSNIMLDCNGSIRLIDIGSACLTEAHAPAANLDATVPPPEFLEGGEWTTSSDLASLGYVLVELLSGRLDNGGVLGGESTQAKDRERDEGLLESKRRLPELLPELMPDNVRRCDKLMRLCRMLIDPDPKNRFADAHQAVETDGDGTWHIRMDLVRGNLAVKEASAIKSWIDDVKRVAKRLRLGPAK